MNENRWIHPNHVRVKSCAAFENIVGRALTDRKIAEYEEMGWYSSEAKRARLERAEKNFKGKKRDSRDGNWVIGEGGNLIYSPK